MGRIDAILEQAASSSSKVEDALLQCVILADELNYEPLKTWANKELSGYDDFSDLPDYRKGKSALRGTLWQGRSYRTGYTIPDVWVDESIRDTATTIYSYKGIGYMSSMRDDGKMVQHHVDMHVIESSINSMLQENNGPFVFVESVSLQIPPGHHDEILSAVRHRLVQFMIDLKKVFPDQDKIEQVASGKLPEVNDSFERFVLQIESVGTLNVGQNQEITDRSQHLTVNVAQGDFDSLGQYLTQLGIPDEQVQRLRPIAERLAKGDGSEDTEGSIRDWVEELPEKGLEAAGEGAKKAIVEGVFQGLMKYAPRMTSWLSNVDVPFL